MRDIEQGSGQILHSDGLTRLIRPSGSPSVYSNAQQDDYADAFLHRAPISLKIRAAFSHAESNMKGTAGFGFWNAPIAPGHWRLRLPKTAWFFFGSPPLNLPLAMGVPGSGFKAATLDAAHWPFFLLLPAAPPGFLLARNAFFYRHLWAIGQKAIRASECALSIDMTQPHTYQIDWLEDRVLFSVDESPIHTSPYSPSGPMGIVIWIDNQYAVATPQGRFAWGLLDCTEPQWLDIYQLELTPHVKR